ncbi:MAG: hypothetical protein ACRCXO_03595, partial [Kluyvera intermedia]
QRAGVFSFQQQLPPGIKPPQHCASPENRNRDCGNPIAADMLAAIADYCLYIHVFIFRNLA